MNLNEEQINDTADILSYRMWWRWPRKNSKFQVLIIGTGGLGAPAALYLQLPELVLLV